MEAKRKTHTVHLTDTDVSDVLWAIENHLEAMEGRVQGALTVEAVANLKRIQQQLDVIYAANNKG